MHSSRRDNLILFGWLVEQFKVLLLYKMWEDCLQALKRCQIKLKTVVKKSVDRHCSLKSQLFYIFLLFETGMPLVEKIFLTFQAFDHLDFTNLWLFLY